MVAVHKEGLDLKAIHPVEAISFPKSFEASRVV